ncbi:MAG TPA: MFS transporter [Stellaceae bacterium]|nr:MFS transporter [Stellaceae bacterium]
MATPQAAAVDIGELLDKQKLSLFHLGTFLLCALIIIVDAADTGSANVAAPAILRAFPAERSVMGWVFAWGAIGVFFGSLIFGYIGDRYGRRTGVILSVLFYSIPALGTAFAGSLEQLMIWRFVTGLGIGGAIPNTIALLNEAAPKRYRASFVVFAFLGYAIGTGSSGQVAGWFTPIYGWLSVFVAVGIVGLLLVVLLAFCLPESLRYLIVTDPNSPVLRRRAAKLFPDAGIGPDTRFVLVQEERETKVALRELFAGNLRVTTPLLWVSYFCESFTYLGFTAWLSTIMETAGLSHSQAAFAFSYAGFAGVLVLLSMSRLLDFFGPTASVVTAIIGIGAMMTIGVPGLSIGTYMLLAVITHSFCAGTHNSLNSTVGMFYPTRIRGNGVGWATAMGRIGGTTGPLAVGYVFSAKVPLDTVLYAVAGPYLVVMVLNFMLGRIYRRQFRAPLVATAGE